MTRCDSCGTHVDDRWRTRHADCPPPPLPPGFYAARDRVRNMAHNVKANR